MGQGSGVPRLGLEPGQRLARLGVTGVQQLDRDRPGQDGVGGPPYLALPADADALVKDVTAGEERRGKGHQRPLPSPPDFNHGTVLA
jgi:hypothetical protein